MNIIAELYYRRVSKHRIRYTALTSCATGLDVMLDEAFCI